MDTTPRHRWKTLLAFAIIYLVWGSTFLAIRVGVHEVPPFLFAGIRFFTAGIILYAWMRARARLRRLAASGPAFRCCRC